MDERKIIINADDFGFSDNTVDATIECFNNGMLSSATLMPNMPAFEKAAEFARKSGNFSFGLHLCLTDEYPISKPDTILSLVDKETGKLLSTNVFRKKALLGQLCIKDILTESRAQLRKIINSGIQITHIDSHGHIHKVPEVLLALPKLSKEFNIKAIRRTQNLYFPVKSKKRVSYIYNKLSNNLVTRNFKTTDNFLMFTDGISGSDQNWWNNVISILPGGVTEIGIHPGLKEDGWRYLEVMPILTDRTDYLHKNKIQLINYKDILC